MKNILHGFKCEMLTTTRHPQTATIAWPSTPGRAPAGFLSSIANSHVISFIGTGCQPFIVKFYRQAKVDSRQSSIPTRWLSPNVEALIFGFKGPLGIRVSVKEVGKTPPAKWEIKIVFDLSDNETRGLTSHVQYNQ